MIKKHFSRVFLLCFGMMCFTIQEVKAQQESAVQELQVVSFTEADKSDFDTTTPSNFAGELKTTALIKVYMPGEIESTDPKSSKEIERKMTSTGYAYYVWVEQHANSIRIVPKGNKFQTKMIKFKEYDIPLYSPKNKKGGLQAGKVYRLVLRDPSPVYIDTHLQGTYATVDGSTNKIFADDNGRIALKDLSAGDHTAYIFAGDGSTRGSVQIKEADQDKVYEHDVRKKARIDIHTNPDGFQIQIKDGEFIEKYDPNKEYTYKSYTVIANFNGNVVEKPISVDDKHTSFIIPNTKTFDITPMYMGSATSAIVFENKKSLNPNEDNDVVRDGYTYHITRPVGTKYKYYASGAGGKSKNQSISVENGMQTEYRLPIAARNSFVWPWQREYAAAPMGVAIGYVQKQMVTKGEGERYKQNIWGEEDKWLHGMQVGFYAQPCFSWGLGLYTGLFYEFYLSSNGSGADDEYDDWQEHNIVIPVHALFRLPFGKKVALSVHGGLGFSYAVYGAFKKSEYEDYTDFYGEDAAPKRFNMALEGGLDFRVGPVQIGLLYSKGLNDHGSYSYLGDYKTTYNKIGINIAWVVGSN